MFLKHNQWTPWKIWSFYLTELCTNTWSTPNLTRFGVPTVDHLIVVLRRSFLSPTPSPSLSTFYTSNTHTHIPSHIISVTKYSTVLRVIHLPWWTPFTVFLGVPWVYDQPPSPTRPRVLPRIETPNLRKSAPTRGTLSSVHRHPTDTSSFPNPVNWFF